MPTISSMLTALNSDYATLSNLIPNKYNFTDEPNLSPYTYIQDGGFDMFDNSNVLNTNLTNVWNNVKTNGFNARLNTSIPYTHTKHTNSTFSFNGNGTVQNGTAYFGSGSSYFTNLYPGFFVLVATNVTITEFSMTGNSGIDGGGSLATNDFTLDVNGTNFAIYRKTLYGTNDPGVNQIMIVPGTGSGITHSWDTSRSYDDNIIQGISGTTDIYYLLIASRTSSGQNLTQQQATDFITEFLTTIEAAGSDGSPIDAVGSAAGIATASAVGVALFNSIGSAAGIATASAVGAALFNSIGSAAGIATASAVGAALFNSIGSAAGIATASAVGITQKSILTDSVESEESVQNLILSQTIFANSTASSEDVAVNAINQTIATTDIDQSNNPTQASLIQYINPETIDQGEIDGAASIRLSLTIQASSVESDEIISSPNNIGNYFYVSGQYVCDKRTNSVCKTGDGMVAAITVLNQKLYKKNPFPIPVRPRKGFFIPTT